MQNFYCPSFIFCMISQFLEANSKKSLQDLLKIKQVPYKSILFLVEQPFLCFFSFSSLGCWPALGCKWSCSFKVLLFVILVHVQRFLLCWAVNVRLIFQQLLDSQQNLLHCDVRLPVLFVIQDRQAHGSWWVDVRVWQYWLEHAFGWSDRKVVAEVHWQTVLTSFPWRIFGSRYDTVPLEKIDGTVRIVTGLGDKTKRMVWAPIFSLFFETIDDEFVDFFFHEKFIWES